MNRVCGGCTLCCKLLPVPQLAKPASTRCQHQSSRGCAVYHKRGFPPSCAIWNCRWLVDDAAGGLHRPDRSHYVIDIMPDIVRIRADETSEVDEVPVIQVWVDPAWPEAWRDPALIAYAEAQGEPLLIRYNTKRAVFVVPPALTASGEMVVHHSSINAATVTGSLLLDKFLARENAA